MKVQVIVKPGSKVEKIIEVEGSLVVYLHARAHDGEANVALIKALSGYYGVAKSQIEVIRGQKSRQKTIEITGV